ncbi:hypothetical protein BS636_03060 [Acinetobacter sp. LoGeW2-3]|uniref:hypothetical protein n=1 Tax=Acinetobacter sp. LoGeW2-3 TaxID=1808001 RepID=UPI000C0598AE|nr:hypothetical protein [Acinetobacter sp. LoGeW2-3]ATO18713.1 hypothetical protein BS636_03060 [Acinetobacter sp. LoGeW2-3]
MLFNALFALMVILYLLYVYGLVFKKQKNYYLSIMIRLLTLGLFILIIFDQHETQTHLILVLLTWVLFESSENFYNKKLSSSK